MEIKIIIKVILVSLLIGCLASMPYGYYQLVRIASFVGFIWLAYLYGEKLYILSILSIGLAILFNPIYLIRFKKNLWHNIDLWVAVFLVILTLIELVILYRGKRMTIKKHNILS